MVGTGGAPWLPLRAAPAANTQVRASATFGVLRLTLRPRGYAWRFINAAGSPVTDQGQAACH